MNEGFVTVAEAAKDFVAVLERIERTGSAATLMRGGKAVAKIVPVLEGPSSTVEDLIRRWAAIERLPSDEAEAFAADLEKIHADQPPLKSAWD